MNVLLRSFPKSAQVRTKHAEKSCIGLEAVDDLKITTYKGFWLTMKLYGVMVSKLSK